MTTESHIFEGNGSFCLKCFKSYVVGNHLSQASVELSKPKVSILDFIVAKSQPAAEPEPIFQCAGHVCSSCGSKIVHNYDCTENNRKLSDLLCAKCTESAAVSLNRESDLDFLENLEAITPKDAKEIDLAHEAFLETNIYRNPDGTERPQEIWQPLWEKHYANLMASMERFKIRASVAYRTKAKKQIDEIAKLSPQERAEFNKLAKQQRLTEHTKKQAKSSVAVKAETEKKKYDANLAAIKALMLSQGVSEEAINKLMAAKKQ